MARRRQRGGFIVGLLSRSIYKKALQKGAGLRKQKGGILPLLVANVIRRKARESFKRQ